MTSQEQLELAAQHYRAGRVTEAETLCRDVLAQEPNYPEALRMLAWITFRAGKTDDALALLGRAISLHSGAAVLHSDLAQLLLLSGRVQEAIEPLRQALRLRSHSPEDWNNLGHALQMGGKVADAIAAHRKAIELRPDFAPAHYNLGAAYDRLGDVDGAIAAYENAIRCQPDHFDAQLNLANLLRDTGRSDEAIEGFRKAVRSNPALSPFCNLILSLHYHPGYDNRQIAQELARFNEVLAKPLAGSITPHDNDPAQTRRIRIGYLSPDFHEHPIGRYVLPLLSNQDHNLFEVVCYNDVHYPDEITAKIRRCADIWRDVADVSDPDLARLVRQDKIDILVDLTLHSAFNRLLVFARKPAPVQVTFLGYPGSSGLETIDWRISDNYLDPPGFNDQYYSEKTLRLPDCYWCYDPLVDPIPVNDLPARSGVITFGCLNYFAKVTAMSLDLWAQILLRVPNSRLLLLAPRSSARQRVVDRIARHTVPPARVQFVDREPRQSYLSLYHQIDVSLDTFPYNGHTTSFDSLWMGVPLVTLYGNTAVSRAGLSILSNIGMAQLASDDPNRFVKIAVDLADDLGQLASIRATLRAQMEHSPLMDQKRYAKNLEGLFRLTWEQWRRSKPA